MPNADSKEPQVDGHQNGKNFTYRGVSGDERTELPNINSTESKTVSYQNCQTPVVETDMYRGNRVDRDRTEGNADGFIIGQTPVSEVDTYSGGRTVDSTLKSTVSGYKPATLNDLADPAKHLKYFHNRIYAKAEKDEDGKKETDENYKGSKEYRLMCKGLTLCVAYGCNIGGIATLSGTPPNLVFKGQADHFFNKRYDELQLPRQGSGVSFSSWMTFAVPMSALTLFLAWITLMILFLRKNMFRAIPQERKNAVKAVIEDEWRQMGRVTTAEVEITVLFSILAVMWISRDPKQSPGWSVWFMTGYVSDASAAMLIAVALFILPARVPQVFCFRKEEHAVIPHYCPLLTWEQVNRKLPWGVIILLGGGFALAKACQESGLSAWVGKQLTLLVDLDPWLLNLILCTIVAVATEVTSNTATASLLMPIMFEMAKSAKLNPLYIMVPTAVSTSFAFMLPVATPPNAIVFSYGQLKVFDMAWAGLFMNIISVLVLTLTVNTWGSVVLGLDTIPGIFESLYRNGTQSP